MAACFCHSSAQRHCALEKSVRLLKRLELVHQMMKARQLPNLPPNEIKCYVVLLQ